MGNEYSFVDDEDKDHLRIANKMVFQALYVRDTTDYWKLQKLTRAIQKIEKVRDKLAQKREGS